MQALGFRIKTGLAVALFVDRTGDEVRVVGRRLVSLAGRDGARFVHHAALDLPEREGSAATRRLIAAARKVAAREMRALDDAHGVKRAGIVVGSLTDPNKIPGAHMRAHALEGKLYRDLVVDALEAAGIRTTVLLERGAYEHVAAAIGEPANALRGRIASLGANVKLNEMRDWLAAEHDIVVLGALGFENAYCLAMRRDRAAQLSVGSISDLPRAAGSVAIGADLEFFSRPEWPALRDSYALTFATRREFAPTFMYEAVVTGEFDVITAFSSDGRIAANDLVVLEDPQRAILPYDAIVLVAEKRADDPLLRRALAPLLGAIPVELMREANFRVDRDVDKQAPSAAARWLATQVLLMCPSR